MRITGKLNTYEVKWGNYGYTGTSLIVYEERLIFGFFKVLKEVHRMSSSNVSPEKAERMTADEMERWFRIGVADYEKIVDNRAGFTKKDHSGARSIGTYISWVGIAIALMIVMRIVSWIWAIANQPEPEKPVLVNEQIERYMLVEMNPPKHFYVTLKRVSDGKVIEHRYVSKHCNSFRDNSIGDEYNITVKTWRYESSGETMRTMENLYNVFCR